ncbi:MAG: DMT family transporter [Synergistales bacterium]
MTVRKAELLLASVILARSTSFLFTKIGMESIGIFNLLGVRFSLAFLLLAVLFWRRLIACRARTVFRGMLLGGAFFSVMTAELMGLRTTSTSTTAFLENTAVVFVPLFEAVLQKRFPNRRIVINTGVAFFGIALLTLRSSLSLTVGEAFCILAAVLYALSIILTDRLAKRDNALMLGILQVGFMGLFGILAAFIFETPRLPSGGIEWGVILILAVVCTGFGFTLQPVAQNGTTSERAGLYCALNPVFASFLGTVFLHEHLGFRGIAGSLLVLSAVALSHVSKDGLKAVLRTDQC